MNDGPLPVYFHGLPGSGLELGLFGKGILGRVAHFDVAHRDFGRVPDGSDRFALMAEALKTRHGDRPLRLVGFSLGAAAALRVAPFLGDQAERIDLVSAAAPLDLGDYLHTMAGAGVFRCARHHPTGFRLLSAGQSILARLSRRTLFALVFSRTQGADAQLRDDPHFRDIMEHQLYDCLVGHLEVYRAEIAAYVDNWSALLRDVSQPVALYHGRSDNWSPVEMAIDLSRELPDCQTLEVMEGLSHYSTLFAYLQRF